MKLMRLGLLVASLGLGPGIPGSPVAAASITCCGTSSDSTPASVLGLVLDFAVSGSTLTLEATNTSAAYRVNQIYFNASDDVTSLALTSATHSVAGNVTSRWSLLAEEDAGGLKTFDFELAGGNGARTWVLDPSESVVFVLTIGGSGPFTAADFIVLSEKGYGAAAKFQGGPGDDSAFGAIPEPGLLGLIALGACLLVARRGS